MLSRALRSSRTLPGQRYVWNRRMTSGGDAWVAVCLVSLISFRKCSTKIGMSSGRSRSGGSWIVTTFRR